MYLLTYLPFISSLHDIIIKSIYLNNYFVVLKTMNHLFKQRNITLKVLMLVSHGGKCFSYVMTQEKEILCDSYVELFYSFL